MTHPTRQQQRERRERIILRLCDGATYEVVAEEFQITRARVGQIAKFAGIVRRPKTTTEATKP